MGRHTATRRANNLDSSYQYDRASRLKELRHAAGSTTFARFRYTVDRRGNRVRAVEALRTGDGQVVTPGSSPDVIYLGSWTGDTTNDPKAILRVPFASDQITLKMGEGPNYSLYGVYIDGALWGTLDGYSASNGTRQIAISLNQPDPHLLEIRSRARRSWRAAWPLRCSHHVITPGTGRSRSLRRSSGRSTFRPQKMEHTAERTSHTSPPTCATLEP